MMYRIRDGERFVLPDGKELSGGSTIELDNDTAHRHRVELIVEAAHEKPADKADDAA